MHETGARLKLVFTSMLRLLIGVLNKDLTVWLNGLSPQTPVSWGCIFSRVRPFYERAVRDLGPIDIYA
jgi:hypothetical protein